MKGIHDAFGGRNGIVEHVAQALREMSTLSNDTSLPVETKRSDDFVRKWRLMDVANFCGVQMDRLSIPNDELSPRQIQWGGFVDPPLRPAAEKIRTMTIKHLSPSAD